MNCAPKRLEDFDVLSHIQHPDDNHEVMKSHPSHIDLVYLERRNGIASLALGYRHGQPIPRVDYNESEINTWRILYKKLTKLHEKCACEEYKRGFRLLETKCNFNENEIPQLEIVSNFLKARTGFTLKPASGLVVSRTFLAGLAFRLFHSTQYVRHPSDPTHSPEPDVCHELIGHVPLFADNDFADLSQEIGLASLGAPDDLVSKLAACYIFTVEFGICIQESQRKVYGAALLSSCGEMERAISNEATIKLFEPEHLSLEGFTDKTFQPVYYQTSSFKETKEKLRLFVKKISKPAHIHYDQLSNTLIREINELDDALSKNEKNKL